MLKNPRVSLSIRRQGLSVVPCWVTALFGSISSQPASATATPQSSNVPSPIEEKLDTRKEKNEKGKKDKRKNKKYDEVLQMYERLLESKSMDIEALKNVLYGKLRQGKMETALET